MKKAIIGGMFIVVLILTMTGIVPSCTHDVLNLTQFDTVCFERDILPVFPINPEDYGIKIPGVVRQNIAESMKVTVQMNYQLYTPKK